MHIKVYYGIKNTNDLCVDYYNTIKEFDQNKGKYDDLVSVSVFDDDGYYIKDIDV